jgi:hypothetical protein
MVFLPALPAGQRGGHQAVRDRLSTREPTPGQAPGVFIGGHVDKSRGRVQAQQPLDRHDGITIIVPPPIASAVCGSPANQG